ncbi:MAG: aminoacyl-tRNA hydrolase, partial [Pseudomonadota bacterium]
MTITITAIAGLGNPGDKYAATRHNAGFWLADELARRHGGQFRYERRFDADVCRVDIDGSDVWLVKPQGYMNESGRVLRAFVDYYRLAIPSLLVVHDEIDLPVGTVRIKKGGGHGGHNGLRDVSACLGGDYTRARVGVVEREPARAAGVGRVRIDRQDLQEALVAGLG